LKNNSNYRLNVQRRPVAALECQPVEASYGRPRSGQRGGRLCGGVGGGGGYQRVVMVLLLASGLGLIWTT